MAWYVYRFWGSDNGQSYSDVTDRAPHPTFTIPLAVDWAHREVAASGLTRYRYLELQRRQGQYRPRGEWKVLACWRFGKPVSADSVSRLKAIEMAQVGESES